MTSAGMEAAGLWEGSDTLLRALRDAPKVRIPHSMNTNLSYSDRDGGCVGCAARKFCWRKNHEHPKCNCDRRGKGSPSRRALV